MSIFSFLNKSKSNRPDIGYLKTDVHSHLIPAIDDGVQTIEESLEILREMENLGYSKVITTPHTMTGSYDNSPEIINAGLEKVRTAVYSEGIKIKVEAATEYFLDETFMEKLEKDEPLMTFGENLVLIEDSFPVFYTHLDVYKRQIINTCLGKGVYQYKRLDYCFYLSAA